MQRNSIILTNESRLLREILKRVIEKTPDFRVADEVTNLAELPDAVEESCAQWIIMSLRTYRRFTGSVEILLDMYPSLRILAMATDGTQVKMRCVGSKEEDLSDLSLHGFIEALRQETPFKLKVQKPVRL